MFLRTAMRAARRGSEIWRSFGTTTATPLKCDPNHAILFEPVKLGPVTAPNRFFQVPHASSAGPHMPHTRAAIREVRAAGGWGVVCTGYVSIHPSADDAPFVHSRMWSDDDIPTHRLMTDAVHRHGALAGVELWHGANYIRNRFSREAPMSASGLGWHSGYSRYGGNTQTATMSRADIRDFKRWWVTAAERAREAGFDVIYVYAGMGYGPFSFIPSRLNRRTDEYGGSLVNRVRLLRETLEEVSAAVGRTCAVACRFTVDELLDRDGVTAEEGREALGLLAEVPDLWDVKISGERDCGSARLVQEAYQEPHVSWVKKVTSKPVVGTGRFTTPDTMADQIRRGVLDLIGAARPSIADPFLPNKIKEGRAEDIRECIGCNICIGTWHEGTLLRCTQNPTMGEEWRKGWHPERIAPAPAADTVLVVGAGPAGLECARAAGQRGFRVMLSDARAVLGGRCVRERTLPGLSTWARVSDYRLLQIARMANVEVYRGSTVTAQDVLDLAPAHVVIATGAKWTSHLLTPSESISEMPPLATQQQQQQQLGGAKSLRVLTPDDIMDGSLPVQGPVLVYDFEHFYMGAAVTERLYAAGLNPSLLTPSNELSVLTYSTHDQMQMTAKFRRLGIPQLHAQYITGFDSTRGALTVRDWYTNEELTPIPCATLVVVGHRAPCDELYWQLMADCRDDDDDDDDGNNNHGRANTLSSTSNSSPSENKISLNGSGVAGCVVGAAAAAAGIRSISRIGDALMPGALVHATYSGHSCARALGNSPPSPRTNTSGRSTVGRRPSDSVFLLEHPLLHSSPDSSAHRPFGWAS